MEFNFDIKKTRVSKSLALISFPLFKYAKILSQLFLYLALLSVALIAFSYIGLLLESIAIKILLANLILCLVFFEIHAFMELFVKQQKPSIALSLVAANVEANTYNIAEFLSLNALNIVKRAEALAKKYKFPQVTSQVLFYVALKDKDCSLLLYRLGIDVKQLLVDLKNFLEKELRQKKLATTTDSFTKTIAQALITAVERQKEVIGEKELLVALAKHDKFFKQVLVNYDLKEKDVQNVTLWLDEIEQKIAKGKQFWTRESLDRLGSLGRDFASGFTVTLDKYSVDLTKIASHNRLHQVVGHQKEIESLELALTGAHQSNVLIIGDPGIGKKSIVEALAKRCFLKTGLVELVGKRVVELDMTSLVSQIQSTEQIETVLDQIFQETLRAGNIILVITDLERYVGQKVQKAGELDISGILAKYIALPNFRFIGITTYDGLHKNIEQNSTLLNYFRKIEVTEVSELETINILQDLALQAEQRHKLVIIYPAIREIINLTSRYFSSTPFPKKAIDILDEAVAYAKAAKEKIVLPSHIAKIISDKTQIPLGKIEFKEKSVLLNLESLIHERIIGQDEAVNEIAIAMRRARSGLSSKKRPMGVFLFLGPTGVGKTETAKALAQIYFGGENKMIRLDMSEFQAISDIGRLIGKAGQEEEQGLLTTPVRENPFSLVLLDEIEKAHPNILNLFLQVFDEGYLTDGQGRKILFNNTIIICTSNAGADLIFQAAKEGIELEKNKVFDLLFQKAIFKPELVNRFDAAVFFHALTRENLMDIAQLSLGILQKNLKEKDIDFIITPELKEKVVELSYKPEFGAREMRRVVQDKIENTVAQALLSDSIGKGDSIEMNPENFEIIKIKS